VKLAIRVFDAHEDGTRGFLLSEDTHEIPNAINKGGFHESDATSVGCQIVASALDTEDDFLQIVVEIEDDEGTAELGEDS
jgi:hypothetical protein